MVNGTHSWMLVGPWYRWPSPGVPSSGRTSVPFLQKYETSDFVNEFLKDPQHSLVFLENEDRVFEVTPRVPPLPMVGGKVSNFAISTASSPSGVRPERMFDQHPDRRFNVSICSVNPRSVSSVMVLTLLRLVATQQRHPRLAGACFCALV